LLIIGITVFTSGLLVYVAPLANFFKFESLNTMQLLISIAIGFLAVIWYEAVKWAKRRKTVF
jgi:Ca2+-transporting ATPase